MNIDIVNKQVAQNLKYKEEDVKLVNSFYWKQVYEHLYSYNPNPVSIENICVLYPNKYSVKNFIYKVIYTIRGTRNSKRYNEGSIKQKNYLAYLDNLLRNAWNIRKVNKFYN